MSIDAIVIPAGSAHSSAEYVERVITLIGRTEEHIASFLSERTQSCVLDDGTHGGPRPPCASCGRLPVAIRPPISFATLPLPSDDGVIFELQGLIAGDHVRQGPLWGEMAATASRSSLVAPSATRL